MYINVMQDQGIIKTIQRDETALLEFRDCYCDYVCVAIDVTRH